MSEKIIYICILSFILFMSLIGFFLMGEDKRRAKRGLYRISEAALFAVAILFGGIGSLAGTFVFRHKTRRAKFKIFFTIFAIIDFGTLVYSAAKLLLLCV